MMNITTLSVWLAVATPVLGVGGYAAKYYADNEYVRQEVWVQENRRERKREIQYKIDELEYIQTQRALTGKEQWQLQRLKSELNSN